jgi:hypothetical protein
MEKFAVTAGVLLAGISVVLAVIFFAATQVPSGRDWICITLGFTAASGFVGLIAIAVFHRDSRAETRRAAQAVASRKAELVSALPTRREEVDRLRQALTDTRVAHEAQKSMVNSHRVEGIEAQNNRMLAFAAENFGLAEGYMHRVRASEEALPELQAELERVQGLTDDEFFAEAKALRDLD